ncbi:MAG: beta-glucuronidase [Candidatus Aminicenantes bacterium]|nr:beta-glucuronidase [Candidatus Aminicenantes bacterium]
MKKYTFLFFMLIFVCFTGYAGEQESELQSSPIPRLEYPRPQFVRSPWVNLNGIWTYTFDFGISGKERGFANSQGFEGEINVPFCPESSLSGVGYKDFIPAMWYQRSLFIPTEWEGKKIILHFGAVDYETEAFIDRKSVGKHYGGTSSFCFDITPFVSSGGTYSLVVYVLDDNRSGVQPSGKQCPAFKSRGCHYTRTTGIWQTVWMEAVSEYGLKSCLIIPDLDQKQFLIQARFYSVRPDLTFQVKAMDGSRKVSATKAAVCDGIICPLRIKKPKTWSPKYPFLYDLIFEVTDSSGQVLDQVRSYAGLRKIHIQDNQIYLNNEPYYLRLVLDQGFYPDGIWTAPSDAALKKDIELSMSAGFNGARLHQKVFEERFHYWADRLGYLTWGESSSWGIDLASGISARNFLTEWQEIIVRDRNHPSIIAWTPFNEAWSGGENLKRLLIDVYALTHSLDPTRPVNDSSGGFHVKTDLWTEHTYEQDLEKLKELLELSENNAVWRRHPERSINYQGQPYLIDEYGGIKWIPSADKVFADDSWGYGEDPTTLEEFYTRLEGLTDVILGLPHICGFCYTQLTDIEQEQNGIFNYDRTEKFNMSRIRSIISKPTNTKQKMEKVGRDI